MYTVEGTYNAIMHAMNIKLTVNLSGLEPSRSHMSRHVYVDFPPKGLTHEGRFHLNFHSTTILWPSGSDWIKKEEERKKPEGSSGFLFTFWLWMQCDEGLWAPIIISSSMKDCMYVMSQKQILPLKSCFCQAFCHSKEENIKYLHKYMHAEGYSPLFPFQMRLTLTLN